MDRRFTFRTRPPAQPSLKSAEAVDKLARGQDLDFEWVGIDCEEVVVTGDERGGMMSGRERHEVVVVGIAADSGVGR
jgi:hypothetical protein